MSAEAVGFVYRHSPYQGVVFSVHLAVADSVNDQFDNMFWMATGRLADKARTSRQSVSAALMRLEADGWLSVVERRDGSTVRYRFLFPESEVVYESRGGVKPVDRGVKPVDRGVSSETTGGVKPRDTNPIEPKGNPSKELLDEFELWYKNYPRKVGRNAALRAFLAARKETSFETLVDSLDRAVEGWRDSGTEPRFICHPATWLRQGRYHDEDCVPAVVAGTTEKDRVLEGALSLAAAIAATAMGDSEMEYALADYPQRVHAEAWALYRQIVGAA